MQNRRKNKRLNCLVPVDSKTNSIFDSMKAVDISKGGMGFIAQHKLALNQEIAIEIDLDQEDMPAFVIGKVRWVQQVPGTEYYRVGMSFENVLRGSKSRLDKFFKKDK